MKNTFRALLAAAIATGSLSALAANDGTVGTTDSSGDFEVRLEVGTVIVAKNFDDMLLTTVGATPGSPIADTEDFCVGGLGFTNFSVSLSSTNGASAGQYVLQGGSDSLNYNVAFANDTTASSGTAPTSGSDAVAGSFSTIGNLACGTDNSRIFVSIPALEWESATETVDYTDTLTVTVTAL